MSKQRAIALLDRPSPQSLGMLGLAVDYGHGELKTEGVVSPQPQIISNDELNDLISGRHALKIEGPNIEAVESPRVALWIGDEFSTLAEKYDLTPPPLPKVASGRVVDGRYWIAEASLVSQVMD